MFVYIKQKIRNAINMLATFEGKQKDTAEHMSVCNATQVADAGLTRRLHSHLTCHHSSVHIDLHTCSKVAAREQFYWLERPWNGHGTSDLLASQSCKSKQLPCKACLSCTPLRQPKFWLDQVHTCKSIFITKPRHRRTMVQCVTSAFDCKKTCSHAHTPE